MSGLGLSGLASGFNTDAVIQKILNIENQKILNQQMKKAQVEAKQDAWKQVRFSLQSLRSALDSIRLASTFSAKAATLSDSNVASVTVTPTASTTTHSLEVTQLATYQVVATKNYDSANERLLTGYAGGTPAKLDIGGKQIEVTATDTLHSLRDKINATADVGVKAEVVKVPVGSAIKYRLVLTATQQGVDGKKTYGDNQGNALLDHLGIRWDDPDDGDPSPVIRELSVAQNAKFKLNGVDYESSSNTITDILPGVTITLKKGGTGGTPASTSITIDKDQEKTVGAVQAFVKALNDTLGLLKDATKYDSDTKKKGLLNGEELARSIMINLRDMVSRTVTGLPSTMNQLSQVGITTGAFGTDDFGKILLDTAKLKDALVKDDQAVAKLFGAIQNNVALSSAGASIDAVSTDAIGGSSVYAPENVLNGDTSSDRFGTEGGGWESPAAPTAGSPQKLTINLNGKRTIEQIRIYQPDNDTYKASASGLKNFKVEYYGTDNQWHEIESVTNHTGPFKTINFDPVVASKVRVTVTATYGTNNPARITEIEVNERNDGTAATMYRYLDRTLFKSATGALDTRDEALKSQVKEIGKQIDKLTEQMTKREAQLRQQFNRMEQAIAKLQGQSGYIAMMSQMMSSGQQR